MLTDCAASEGDGVFLMIDSRGMPVWEGDPGPDGLVFLREFRDGWPVDDRLVSWRDLAGGMDYSLAGLCSGGGVLRHLCDVRCLAGERAVLLTFEQVY